MNDFLKDFLVLTDESHEKTCISIKDIRRIFKDREVGSTKIVYSSLEGNVGAHVSESVDQIIEMINERQPLNNRSTKWAEFCMIESDGSIKKLAIKLNSIASVKEVSCEGDTCISEIETEDGKSYRIANSYSDIIRILTKK